MASRSLWVLGLLAALAAGRAARGQEFVTLEPLGPAGQPIFLPAGAAVAGQPPLFMSQLGAPPVLGRAGGTVGSLNATSIGNLQIGFDYVRPLWSFRDFLLAVPNFSAPAFPLLGDTGHVDDHFTFAPRVDYHYQFTDSVFGVSASGTFLSLSGQLNRQVGSTAAGLGRLTASSQLTVVTANLVEFTGQWLGPTAERVKGKSCRGTWLEGVVLDYGIGTRYSSIDQNYTGSLTSGANVSTRFSTQSFRGIGLTGSLGCARPVSERLVLFSQTRASVLYGSNYKDSTLTVAVAGLPGFSSTINQDRTSAIPILEQELGLEYGAPLWRPLNEADRPPVFTLRVAFVGQFWGDVGPLSAGSTQGFRGSDLFLLGVNLMAGLQR